MDNTDKNKKVCEFCKADFVCKSTKALFCGTICKQANLRAIKKQSSPILEKQCRYCDTVFFPKKKSAMFCCLRCQQLNMRSKKIVDEVGMVPCLICGMKANCLTSHILKIHKMSIEEYKTQYNSPIRSEKYLQEQSSRISGDKNPAYQHGGKFSALSDKFIYANTTNKSAVVAKISKANKENGNTSSTLIYWTKQGYTEAEAKEKLSQRQTTFSLDICIQKYGEIEGKKRWNDRQEKWQESINTKLPEELERINRAKMCNGRGYSKISQKMFIAIYEATKEIYPRPYFATFTDKKEIIDSKDNHPEWFHISGTGKKFFFDYYVKETKSIIEFDGDYWHGEKRGNQKRDADREAILIAEGFRIFHVLERDYKADPEKIITQCVEFLNG